MQQDNTSRALLAPLSVPEREAFFALFSKGPEHVSSHLVGHLNQVEPFVTFLLTEKGLKLETALGFCLWILCGGCPPELIHQIQQAAKGTSNICGRVWKNGDVAYNCRTCQVDDTW